MTAEQKIKKIREAILFTQAARDPSRYSLEARDLLMALVLNSKLIADIMDIIEEKH